ncbi:MAG: helix-turn-helix domain-containing protein [bacterium]|nr:helix-turn-helix domain-containing protein [bacterium]
MTQGEIGIRQIFGLKVRELRSKKGFSYQDLSKQTGLSVSYLNEIEKGKKYPKGDKIMSLAEALGVSYDYLVSLKVSKKIEPVVALLQSDFFRELPLDLLGLDAQKFIELISANPEKINAFINTVLQIARNYELGRENIYYAALRSYQEINDNYFPELEKAVKDFKNKFDFTGYLFEKEELEQILKDYFKISIDYDRLKDNDTLRDTRSYYSIVDQSLSLSSGLTPAQEKFLIVRELAYQYLEIRERPLETPPQRNYSFAQLLNNFRASYFAVAFLMDEKEVISDIRNFVRSKQWHDQDVLKILEKYDATPEMLMQRLTNILPKYFGFNNLFFLRFTNKPGADGFKLTKELHLSKLHNPHANELNEHYCRRWISIGIIQELLKQKKLETIARLQISKYLNTKNEYLCLSVAFPNSTNTEEGISITVGFQIDSKLKEGIQFLEDPKIIEKEVHTTCERCPARDCNERAAPPWQLDRELRKIEIERGLNELENS